MSAYQADPDIAPVRIHTLRTRDARRWGLHRQSTEPVLYSDFFSEQQPGGLVR